MIWFKNLLIVFTLLLGVACKKIPHSNCPVEVLNKFDNINIAPSMKGWELYSWPNSNKDCMEWNYAILEGTNRPKSYSEITSSAIVLKANTYNELLGMLMKFPANENIVWYGAQWLNNAWPINMDHVKDLQLPNLSQQNRISTTAAMLNLTFAIVP